MFCNITFFFGFADPSRRVEETDRLLVIGQCLCGCVCIDVFHVLLGTCVCAIIQRIIK